MWRRLSNSAVRAPHCRAPPAAARPAWRGLRPPWPHRLAHPARCPSGSAHPPLPLYAGAHAQRRGPLPAGRAREPPARGRPPGAFLAGPSGMRLCGTIPPSASIHPARACRPSPAPITAIRGARPPRGVSLGSCCFRAPGYRLAPGPTGAGIHPPPLTRWRVGHAGLPAGARRGEARRTPSRLPRVLGQGMLCGRDISRPAGSGRRGPGGWMARAPAGCSRGRGRGRAGRGRQARAGPQVGAGEGGGRAGTVAPWSRGASAEVEGGILRRRGAKGKARGEGRGRASRGALPEAWA